VGVSYSYCRYVYGGNDAVQERCTLFIHSSLLNLVRFSDFSFLLKLKLETYIIINTKSLLVYNATMNLCHLCKELVPWPG
jgi:hypothetical protein